jgi:hypothetical protein
VPYLLDGNNLIGIVRRTARPSEEDRAALITELADRLRRTRAKATIFFDGPEGERQSALGGLTVRSPSAGSADDAILREIRRSPAPGELVVVTADRELSRRAREAGARVTPPAEFFARFGRGASPADGRAASPAIDVEDWMRYFEDDRNRE